MNLDNQMTMPDVMLERRPAQRISELLLEGEENAVPLRNLVKITGWDEREVRRAVRRERLAGVPILANFRTGYYLPGSDAERARFVRSMLHRAGEIAAAARAVERGGGNNG